MQVLTHAAVVLTGETVRSSFAPSITSRIGSLRRRSLGDTRASTESMMSQSTPRVDRVDDERLERQEVAAVAPQVDGRVTILSMRRERA